MNKKSGVKNIRDEEWEVDWQTGGKLLLYKCLSTSNETIHFRVKTEHFRKYIYE